MELYNEKEVQEFEIENNRKTLKEALKDQQRTAEMIKTLELKKAIVDEERITMQKDVARRVKKISTSYQDMYLDLGKKFDKYKDFMVFELESHEQIRAGLEKVIEKK